MAATANLRKSVFGNMRVLYGTFTANAGDDTMAVGVNGGMVVAAEFKATDATTGMTRDFPWKSTAAGTPPMTVTAGIHEAVTNGQFIIHYK